MSLSLRGWGIGVGLALAVARPALASDDLTLDAMVTDGGSTSCDAGSGLSCEMCDVSGFTPDTMQKPIGPMAMACTDNDISNFITACGMSGTASACSMWEMSTSMTCVGCVITQSTASSWGPIVCTSSTQCSYNAQGCVDLTLNQVSMEKSSGGAGSCGDLLNASYGCQDYACGTCSTTDFPNCANSAVANECSSYATAAQSTTGPCGAIDGSASETSCFLQGGDSDISALVTLMCGGLVAPPPDAGSDSGTTTGDGGSNKDGGSTSKDGGSGDGSTGNKDSGPDGGAGFNNGSGCHCDAAGAEGTGNALVMLGIGGFVAAAITRRRKRR
jgi:hypothetical protein